MKEFGTLADGQKVGKLELKNEDIRIEVSEYGSSLVSLWVKDKQGNPVDIVLGFDDVSGYETDEQGTYIGCNVGRFANRVNGGQFVLNGQTYQLDHNEGDNTLHSGFHPYSKRIWETELVTEDTVRFSLLSPDGDQGYPGEMKLTVTYQLKKNALHIIYDAKSSKDTPISITNHSYFNLNGQGQGTILNHKVRLNADTFLPIDEKSIPTGEVRSVKGTPMDFTTAKTVGKDIQADDEQLRMGTGYDHNWCINGYDGTLKEAVSVTSDRTGITMTISTDYPGIQMYTGNFLDHVKGRDGSDYNFREAMCFEPQFYPDSVNRDQFVSPITKAEDDYHKEIVYEFTV